jgi:hypothetical protein
MESDPIDSMNGRAENSIRKRKEIEIFILDL